MDIVDRVNHLKMEQKVNQIKIAQALNIVPSSISDILNRKGRKFSAEHIPKLAKLFQVDESFLLGSDIKIKVRTIPLIGLASCGIPQEYDLNGYEAVPIGEELYHEGMYAVRAEGDSMSPKINNNSLVYCRTNMQIDSGNIVHYSINGESGIKKYKINEKRDIISLIPINSDFDIITVHADDGVNLKMSKVVGVVDTEF
ncbi:MAG: hypothetical protein COB42_08695 [Sulfurimonas sp.]|nr:MAG: hypothetical protein COB42_08695 [Sulfurimonas sp.]